MKEQGTELEKFTEDATKTGCCLLGVLTAAATAIALVVAMAKLLILLVDMFN